VSVSVFEFVSESEFEFEFEFEGGQRGYRARIVCMPILRMKAKPRRSILFPRPAERGECPAGRADR
jgi:hypothetical protein